MIMTSDCGPDDQRLWTIARRRTSTNADGAMQRNLPKKQSRINTKRNQDKGKGKMAREKEPFEIEGHSKAFERARRRQSPKGASFVHRSPCYLILLPQMISKS
jgi:hypothetical protein